MKSKHNQILDYLKQGNSITGEVAWKLFGVYRLSSVILRIRKKYNIKTTMHTDLFKNRFASYSMEQ